MGPQRIASLPAGTLLSHHELNDEAALVDARGFIKLHAKDMGFSMLNQTKIVTAASELGRNVLEHGLGGSVLCESLGAGERMGIRLTFEDSGPGIENLELALSDGYTSKNGLGLGLSGSKRLMDEFEILTEVGVGTTIVVVKWK